MLKESLRVENKKKDRKKHLCIKEKMKTTHSYTSLKFLSIDTNEKDKKKYKKVHRKKIMSEEDWHFEKFKLFKSGFWKFYFFRVFKKN